MATPTQRTSPSAGPDQRGVLIGLTIIGLWLLSTGLLISRPALPPLWAVPLLVLLQSHLYTGLFITAHDAMHGLVSPNKRVNHGIGRLAAALFAYNWYDRLYPRHHAHHEHVATDGDPDYHAGNPGFLAWYYSFARQYITLWQILLMAVTYNVLKLWFAWELLVLFWIVPTFIATFQLFYFGTFLPHKGEHSADNPHKARSQRKNHLWAFLSCYFFGYHYEHHNTPWVPWWQLHKEAKRLTDQVDRY